MQTFLVKPSKTQSSLRSSASALQQIRLRKGQSICVTLWLCFVFIVGIVVCPMPKEGDKPQPGAVW